MNLIAMLQDVWTDSGLAEAWAVVAPWLALDERQLIFVVASPSSSVSRSGNTCASATTAG